MKLTKKQVKTKMDRIKDVFINIPVVNGLDGYPYVFFSITDYTPPMDPQIVEDMADLMIHFGDFESADIIISEADRGGGPITHAVARKTGIHYVLANWYAVKVKNAIKVKTKIGFSGEGYIYLNGLESGQKAIFVDDLLSTGGTADAVITALKKKGITVTEAIFAGEKVGVGGREKLEKNHPDVKITTLVKFTIDDGVTREVGS